MGTLCDPGPRCPEDVGTSAIMSLWTWVPEGHGDINCYITMDLGT